MAIVNNGVRNSLPEAQKPVGYVSPSITVFQDWEYKRTLSLSVLKSTVETAQAAAVAAFGTVTCATAIATNTVTVNGLVYTAVAGAKADNTEFSIDTSDTATATDLADSITNDVRAGITEPTLDVTATSSVDEVTITCTTAGEVGNTIDLSSSDGGTLAVSGALLAGGTEIITSAVGTMTAILDDATIGLNKQVEDIVAADFLATATVTTWAELTNLTHNIAKVTSGGGLWITDSPISYIATVILYIKTT